MKDQILKIAKVKSEKEFYKKYPTEEAFMKAHGKAFKKAAMGAKMVNDQLHQLTDFGNPPQAQVGAYVGGQADHPFSPISFKDLHTNVKATNLGVTKSDIEKEDTISKLNAGQKGPTYKGVAGDLTGILETVASKQSSPTNPNAPSAANNYAGLGVDDDMPTKRNGGRKLKKAQSGDEVDQYAGLIKTGLEKYSQTNGKYSGVAGKVAPYVGDAANIYKGIGQIEEQHNKIAKANQYSKISNLTASAVESQPDVAKRRYVRPEDSLVQPGQLGSPQGVGTNYLSAQNGTSIGGNPTEIQNTYAPNDIYVGLGYQPLDDNNPKQYAHGGNIPTAEFGEYFQDSGQASIGKGIGSAIGSAFFGPVGGYVGGLLGTVGGNLAGGVSDARKLQHFQDLGRINEDRAAWAAGTSKIHAQNANVMKDGGYTDDDHGWVSNGWNPQVITHFGDMNVSQVHNFAHQGMNSLRAGGHLKEYTPPSEEAMYTGRDQYAMGGDLKTTWGGKAETMSHNPYLPGTGETVMFRGQSHDETNGKGQSGIGVKYGSGGMMDHAQNGSSGSDADVEVERGEPAMELVDPQTGEKVLNVAGNMIIPPYGVKEIGDKKAKGKKFKHYVADLSKQETKHNKTIQKAIDIANSSNGNDPFDQLSLNASKAMLMGSNLKLKDIAEKKKAAAMVQNAILDTAEEFGIESDGLAKGKIRAIKDPSIGKDGKKLKKAQVGWHPEWDDAQGTTTPPYQGIPMLTAINADPSFEVPRLGIGQPRTTIPYDPRYIGDIIHRAPIISPIASPTIDPVKAAQHLADIQALKPAKTKKSKGKWSSSEDLADLLNSIYPLNRRTNQVPLDPSQLMGEQYALGNNQLQGVQAQTYQPMLDQPYDISLQDQINAIDSQSRAAILSAGQDPAAQAYIMSQAADAKNKVLGEQFRANQANKAAVYQANRQAMNQAQLQNLGILDQQYVRQETAKSKTKAETEAALNSISDKIAKNKLMNRQLGIYENLYGFRFDDKGRAQNINTPARFNMYGTGKTSGGNYSNSMLPANKRFTVDPITGEIVGIRTLDKDELTGGASAMDAATSLGLTQKNGGTTKKSKNGSIVKAIKNL